MISDGKGAYIRKDFSGKYSPVRNETLADSWEQRIKAKNVLENQLNKNIRNKYHIIEVEIPDVRKIEVQNKHDIDSNIKEIKQFSNEEIEDSQIDKWEIEVESLSNFVRCLEERKESLSTKLSDVDKELVDINHYIEFGDNLNAYEGWLAFSLLRHRLKRRRKIKDELYVISQLSECKINSSMLSNIKEAIHEMDNRVYTPRKLTGLFKH